MGEEPAGISGSIDGDVDPEFEDPTAWMVDEIDLEGYDPDSDPANQPPGPAPAVTRGGAPRPRGRFPVSRAAIPAWVKEFENGKIPHEKMVQVAPLGPGGLVIPEAVEPWRKLQAAASAAGFRLTMTNAYRNYDQQFNLFNNNYTTSDTGGRFKDWNGVRYWQKPRHNMIATPGNSNHGRGVAIDMALDTYDRRARPVQSDSRFMTWVLANARQFGWSWEVQSEAWHIRLVEYDSADTVTTSSSGRPRQTIKKADVPSGVPIPELLPSEEVDEQVRALQTILIDNGWADFTRADGKYGTRTTDAVKKMQGVLGVKVDGKYGKFTAAALAKHLGLG